MPIAFPPDPALLLSSPLRKEHFTDAYATPFARPSPSEVSGALYRSDGTLIELSQRFCGFHGDRVVLADPPATSRDPNAKRVAARTCYIGNIFNHYGHFITEGLSALWDDFADYDYLAAHPFVFGGLLAAYARYCHAALDIDRRKILVIREPTVFEDITVLERSWLPNKAAHPDFMKVAQRIAAPFHTGRHPLRLYLSRRMTEQRNVAQEPAIEDLFRQRGFVVLHPETLTIEAQLALYGQAAVLAGFSGSALHNVMFCPMGTPTINLGDARSPDRPLPNQMICSALNGGPALLIPRRTDDIDLSRLEGEIDESLAMLALG